MAAPISFVSMRALLLVAFVLFGCTISTGKPIRSIKPINKPIKLSKPIKHNRAKPYVKKTPYAGLGKKSSANGLIKAKGVSGHFKKTSTGHTFVNPYAKSK